MSEKLNVREVYTDVQKVWKGPRQSGDLDNISVNLYHFVMTLH